MSRLRRVPGDPRAVPALRGGARGAFEVGDAAAFASRLEREGVIVRPLGPFGDPASVRIEGRVVGVLRSML
ncbi:hypothetical protein B4Q13_15085 [Lacticaseibacillus rhamnosus]